MPLSLYSSSEWPDAGELSLEDHVNTSIVSFGNLTLNDAPNARASPEPTVYEVPTIISSSQKRSTRTPVQPKHNQQASNGIAVVDAGMLWYCLAVATLQYFFMCCQLVSFYVFIFQTVLGKNLQSLD